MQELKSLLLQLNEQEREPLQKLLGCKKNEVDQIIKAYGNLTLKFGGLLQSKPGYRDILKKIANKHNVVIKGLNDDGINQKVKISEIELELFSKLFKQEFDQMTEEEQLEFKKELEKKGLSKEQITSITSLGAITAAQLSGFGVYMLASSTVGAITSLLGITLPFAFYTTMSSTIAFVIGPVGFIALGYVMYRQFRHVKSLDEALDLLQATGREMKYFITGNIERATVAFKYIASVRIIQLHKYDEEESAILSDNQGIESELNKIVDREAYLKEKIDELLAEIQKLSDLLGENRKSKEEVEADIRSLRLKLNDNFDKINSIAKKRSIII